LKSTKRIDEQQLTLRFTDLNDLKLMRYLLPKFNLRLRSAIKERIDQDAWAEQKEAKEREQLQNLEWNF
jgi:hypothetical protein